MGTTKILVTRSRLLVLLVGFCLHANAADGTSDSCSANKYRDCYNGASWGFEVPFQKPENLAISGEVPAKTAVKSFCSQVPQGDIDVIETWPDTRTAIVTCGQPLDEASSKIWIGGNSSCNAILSEHRLVGFWKPLSLSQPEFMLAKAEMRKKYGEPKVVKTPSGRGFDLDSYVFNTPDGLEVDLCQGVASGEKMSVWVRYLSTRTMKQVSDTANSATKAAEQAKKKADLTNTQKALEGL